METPYSPQNSTSQSDPQSDAQSASNQSQPTDPGTPTSGLIALILTIVFAGGIILWQNLPEQLQYDLIQEKMPELSISATDPAPGRFGQFDLPARMFIRGIKLLSEQPDDMGTMVMGQFATAYTPEDKIRTIILSAEYEGPDQALERIEKLQIELFTEIALEANSIASEEIKTEHINTISARNSLVHAELRSLKSIYTNGPDSIKQPKRDQLIARYGLLGQAALVFGLDNDDPQRQPIVTGFGWIATLLFFAFGISIICFLAGFVLLIIGIVQFASGKMKMRCPAPTPGGSVFLETYGVFVAAFAVLSIGLFVLSEKINPALGALALPLQWILMVIPAWALIRGMKSKDWRHAIGLHTGEGVLKEIGCGFLVYIASIPIYLVGIVITLIVLLAQGFMASGSGGPPPEMPSNPVFELISDGGPLIIFLLFTLATIWAPITEELIFRGALYRHMRGRLHWVFAAFFSAVLFAYMHSYGPLMVAPLIALGFMFAFMRQWRGSIIAPMTAHFIHNATLVGFMIIFINLLKDPVIS